MVANDTNAANDIFVRDLGANTTLRASVSSAGAQASGFSYTPGLSPDGTKVVYYSYAPDLVAGDTNGFADVFVRDLTTNSTIRASMTAARAQATGGDSYTATYSANDRVAFSSLASNIMPDDTNGKRDIFVRDLAAGTTLGPSLPTEVTAEWTLFQ